MIKKFSILLSLIFVFSLSLSGERLSPCTNSDDCGKIIGWLYDYDTGMVINEEFAIMIIAVIDGDTYPHVYYELIADSGCFSISVKQGQYVMAITPWDKDTKYPHFYDPHKKYNQDEIITVEKGKITEVRKKIQMGGALKIVMTDFNGERIDIIQKYNVSKITFNLKNKGIDYSPSVSMNKNEIETNEMIIQNLIPGIYDINAYFPKSGLGTRQGGTALIESKKITECKFVLSIDENTGIQGIITDKNGIRIVSAEVILYKDIENFGFEPFGDVETNENGYFKIIGSKEGIYSLLIVSDQGECRYHNIEIRQNRILDKNITLSCAGNK